jgi:hypothetical protein
VSATAAAGLVGFCVLLASGSLTDATSTAVGQGAAVAASAPATSPTAVLKVFTGTTVPGSWAAKLAGLTTISAAVPEFGGTVWLTGSQDAAGRPVDVLPAGQGIPLDLRAADPTTYAALTSPATRAAFTGLRPGEVLLGQTSAALRRIGAGGALIVAGTRLRVAAVVPDADVGYAEVFTSAAAAAKLGVTAEQYLLVAARTGATVEQLSAGVRAALGDPQQTGMSTAAYSVLPQVLEKRYLGEFSVKLHPGPGGWLTQDPNWAAAHLATQTVPILGRVTCNVAMLPALRGALAQVVAEGLTDLVNTTDYGGCYADRTIAGLPTAAISHHAWGSAIDLNVSANPRGGPSHQDPRLIAIFGQWGFTWGGDWPWPDPMHFEFLSPPQARS